LYDFFIHFVALLLPMLVAWPTKERGKGLPLVEQGRTK